MENNLEYLTHDPAIFEDPVTNKFYIYPTMAQAMVSDDLIQWDSLGKVVSSVPAEATDWTKSEQIWAPDIVKVGKEYRLYCSNSSWGVQQSCIFLAVSDKAQGPFEPRGVVIKTDDTLDVNAIDANIIEDEKTGEQYMLYGSFWGGIHLLALDKETGLARDRGEDGNGVGSLKLMEGYHEGMTLSDIPKEQQDKRRGICLAKREAWTSTAIEGPYIIYHPQTEYYYLFVSYGSLKSDYNIRVGRSQNVTGPYVDYNGRDMADPEDADFTRGLMVAAGYRWLSGDAYMGPGHNSVLLRENGDMYLVSHIRKLRFLEDECGPGLLQIRKMYMSSDGWPIAEAAPYSRAIEKKASAEDLAGKYERILLQPMLPQGIMHSHPFFLFADGRMECCSIQGNWELSNDHTIRITYGPHVDEAHFAWGIDEATGQEAILLTGLTEGGTCFWAKKKEDCAAPKTA